VLLLPLESDPSRHTDAVDSQLGHHVDSDPVVVASDGGTTVVENTDDDVTDDDGERPDDCACTASWPCADCYIAGDRDFPDE